MQEQEGYIQKISVEPQQADYTLARFAFLISRKMPLELNGSEHFNHIRSYIDQGHPIVGIANHTSMLDTLVMIRAIEFIARKPLVEIGFPASEKLFDGRMAKEGRVMKATAQLRKGLQFFRMWQAKDDLKPKGLGSGLTNSRAFKKLREIMSRSKPESVNFVGYYTEGGRSSDGTLQAGEPGIDLLFTKNQKAVVVPFGFIGLNRIYDKKIHIDHLLSGQAKVIVGEPFTPLDSQQLASKYNIELQHAYMLKIAALLPQRMWGWYHRYGDIIERMKERKSGIIYMPKR